MLAQVLPLAATPLLTRIFRPEDFGLFAVFTSFSAICAIAATLRFNYAILLPEKTLQALELSAVCLICSALVSILLAGALLPFAPFWEGLLDLQDARSWLWLIPISTFLSGTQLTLYTLVNRERKFRSMSVSKVAQGAGAVFGALVLAWALDMWATGLLWGYLIGQTLGVIVLLPASRSMASEAWSLSFSGLRAIASRYRNFALIGLPGSILNTFSNHLPVFFYRVLFHRSCGGTV